MLVFCMVSVISALYIKWNIDFSGAEVLQTQEVESVVKDEVFIPEIHFLKQLVKSIFNVVTTSL
ncbi:MAG: hypothetical protein LW630_07750 [Saprospiraceae bacterium]|nr:hypothetical protein [Saprospiraceae bacterium]